jgi:hypothetical protein
MCAAFPIMPEPTIDVGYANATPSQPLCITVSAMSLAEYTQCRAALARAGVVVVLTNDTDSFMDDQVTVAKIEETMKRETRNNFRDLLRLSVPFGNDGESLRLIKLRYWKWINERLPAQFIRTKAVVRSAPRPKRPQARPVRAIHPHQHQRREHRRAGQRTRLRFA